MQPERIDHEHRQVAEYPLLLMPSPSGSTTHSPSRRALRRLGIAVIVSFVLLAIHTAAIVATVRHLPLGSSSLNAEDYRRYTTYAVDGSLLYGDQCINQRQSPTRPAYLYTSRGRDKNWFAAAPHMAPVPYEQLSGRLVYYSPRRDLYGLEHGTIATLGYGWPFVAIAADYEIVGAGASTIKKGIGVASGTPIAEQHPRAVPTRIVWAGLLANLALCTMAVYPLFLFGLCRPFVEGYRSRHNRCLGCGYPLDELAVCPECGTARRETPSV